MHALKRQQERPSKGGKKGLRNRFDEEARHAGASRMEPMSDVAKGIRDRCGRQLDYRRVDEGRRSRWIRTDGPGCTGIELESRIRT